LDQNIGQRVLVEEDTAVSGGGTVRYVWLVNPDGTRTLLNQKLVADGLAQAAAIPDDARFGLWLQLSERSAEESRLGLWAGCETPDATSASTSTPTPGPGATPAPAGPSPTPKATRTPASGTGTTWHGQINQLGTIDFTIADGTLTGFSISYTVPCTVPGASMSGSVSSSSPRVLDGDSFALDFGVSAGLTGTVTGTIQGEALAAGTVTLPPLPGCTTEEIQQRWTASPA
jgi:hypothetical protein